MQRNFVDADFSVTTWEKLKSYFDQLLKRKISSVEEFESWLQDISELGVTPHG